MCFSSSKSQSASETDQSQTSITQDGVVTGKVFNVMQEGGAEFAYTDEFPVAVQNAFSQLVELAAGAGNAAFTAFDKSLTATQALASQAAQPDLDLVKSSNSQLPVIIIGSIAAVGFLFLVMKGK